MCSQIVKDIDLRVGDVIEINHGMSLAFILNIHRDDSGITGYQFLRIEDYYVDADTDDEANIKGGDIGEPADRNFVIYYRPEHFVNSQSALTTPTDKITRTAQTQDKDFYSTTIRRANRRMGLEVQSERTSGSMRSSLSGAADMSVFGKREFKPNPNATPRKPPTTQYAKTDCLIKVPDITLVDAVKVALISERALQLLTIKPDGDAQWPEMVMLSDAHGLFFPKKERVTEEDIRAEGVRRRHVGAFLNVALIANKNLSEPLPYNTKSAKRNLGEYFRKRIRKASTCFGNDMARAIDPTLEQHVRDSVAVLYQGIKTQYPAGKISAGERVPVCTVR